MDYYKRSQRKRFAHRDLFRDIKKRFGANGAIIVQDAEAKVEYYFQKAVAELTIVKQEVAFHLRTWVNANKAYRPDVLASCLEPLLELEAERVEFERLGQAQPVSIAQRRETIPK
jgi:hypothetical protein